MGTCKKCGKETKDGQVYCTDCLKVMEHDTLNDLTGTLPEQPELDSITTTDDDDLESIIRSMQENEKDTKRTTEKTGPSTVSDVFADAVSAISSLDDELESYASLEEALMKESDKADAPELEQAKESKKAKKDKKKKKSGEKSGFLKSILKKKSQEENTVQEDDPQTESSGEIENEILDDAQAIQENSVTEDSIIAEEATNDLLTAEPAVDKKALKAAKKAEAKKEKEAEAKRKKEEAKKAAAEKDKLKKEKAAAKKAQVDPKKAKKKAEAEAAKKAKAEKQKEKAKAKKEKAQAKKEAKLNPVEEVYEETEDQGYYSRPIAIAIILTVVMAGAVFVLGSKTYNYNHSISAATKSFDDQEYDEAYQEVYGLDIKMNDEEIYNKIMTVMYVNKQLNSYNSFWELKMYPEALDSLIKGLKRYDKYIDAAKELGIESDLDYVREQIITELKRKFGLSEKRAINLENIADQTEYSIAIYDFILEETDLTTSESE